MIDLLRHVQSLLSHQPGSHDEVTVLYNGLRVYASKLENRKFGATTKPRKARTRSSANPRYIPKAVQRAVWERDGGQCTFVGDSGHRCASREQIEFDHIEVVARGGNATVENIRLRCRAHNQYGAECTYGADYVKQKREESRLAAAERRAAKAREAAEARLAGQAQVAKERDLEEAKEKDVTPWLRQLGFRADQARYAAKLCEAIPDASLEDRVRFALSRLAPRAARYTPSAPPA